MGSLNRRLYTPTVLYRRLPVKPFWGIRIEPTNPLTGLPKVSNSQLPRENRNGPEKVKTGERCSNRDNSHIYRPGSFISAGGPDWNRLHRHPRRTSNAWCSFVTGRSSFATLQLSTPFQDGLYFKRNIFFQKRFLYVIGCSRFHGGFKALITFFGSQHNERQIFVAFRLPD